jgi:hypothetical protein
MAKAIYFLYDIQSFSMALIPDTMNDLVGGLEYLAIFPPRDAQKPVNEARPKEDLAARTQRANRAHSPNLYPALGNVLHKSFGVG